MVRSFRNALSPDTYPANRGRTRLARVLITSTLAGLVACNSADVLVPVPPSPVPSAAPLAVPPLAAAPQAPLRSFPQSVPQSAVQGAPQVAAIPPASPSGDETYGAATQGVRALSGDPTVTPGTIAAPGALMPPPLGQPARIIEPRPFGTAPATLAPVQTAPSVLGGQTPPGALIARPAAPRQDRLPHVPSSAPTGLSSAPLRSAPTRLGPVENAPQARGLPVPPPLAQQAPVQQAFVTPGQMEPPVLPRKPKAAPPALSKAEQQCRKELKRLKVQFTPVKTVRGKMGCGIAHPLKITKLSRRIAMKPAAVMNCQAALASAKWAHRELAPAARRRYASNVEAIHHMSAYSCRRIRGSGRLSEHGKGNALDIGAISLRNGRTIKVAKKGFFSVREKSFLKAIRKGACEHFTTVLGPGYNRDHADHFHFDMKQRRGGRRFCNL